MCTDRKKYASVLVTEDKQAIELWAREYWLVFTQRLEE